MAAGIGLVTRTVPDQMLAKALDTINGFQAASPGGVKQFEKGRNFGGEGGGRERERERSIFPRIVVLTFI